MSKVKVIKGRGKIEFHKEKDKETMEKKYPDIEFEKMNMLTFTTTYKGKEEYDLVINFQGDAPLTPSWFVTDLINALKLNRCFSVATPALKCDIGMVEDLLRDRENSLVGGTTVVFSKNSSALYFSKEVIPFVPLDLRAFVPCL